MENQEKIYWADNLRVLATVSVIILHVSADVLYLYGSISKLYWWAGNLYDSLVRFSVPMFLMLTGALMFRKNYELKDFLKRKFMRIIIPFLFWSLIYLIYNLKTEIYKEGQMTLYSILKWVFIQLKTGSSYHLWYIYMIIGIYLFIPIIGKWIRNSTEKEILYFLFIWLFVTLLNQPYVVVLNIKPNIDFTYFSGYIGYLVLGFYLSIKQFNSNIINKASIGLIIFGASITVLGTYFFTVADGKFSEVFFGYLSPNILIFSIGIFLLFKNYNYSNTKTASFTRFVSKYSYGIYLVHVLVLTELAKKGINCYTVSPIIGIPLTTIICLIISGIIIYTVHKIPFGKYISG